MIHSLSLRPAIPADSPLLFALFAESRLAELAVSGLAPELLRQLLHVQHRGRAMTYAARFPAAQQWIICLEEGTPVGEILVDWQTGHWRIVDLAVLSAWQRRGIAGRGIAEIQRQCADRGIALRLAVAPGHPAERLYRRLGFEPLGMPQETIDSVGQTVMEMEWRPTLNPVPADETAHLGIYG